MAHTLEDFYLIKLPAGTRCGAPFQPLLIRDFFVYEFINCELETSRDDDDDEAPPPLFITHIKFHHDGY
jgi:hypothetical protein